eukprot:4657129-Pyramimonas_sp.AAC.1
MQPLTRPQLFPTRPPTTRRTLSPARRALTQPWRPMVCCRVRSHKRSWCSSWGPSSTTSADTLAY